MKKRDAVILCLLLLIMQKLTLSFFSPIVSIVYGLLISTVSCTTKGSISVIEEEDSSRGWPGENGKKIPPILMNFHDLVGMVFSKMY